MKKYLFILTLLIFASCAEFNDEPDNSPEALLIGVWEAVEASGGIMGHTITYTDTTSLQYFFGTDNSFVIFENDSLSVEGKYEWNYEETGGQYLEYNSTDKLAIFTDQFVEFSGQDTLFLIDRCTDCYTYKFLRLN